MRPELLKHYDETPQVEEYAEKIEYLKKLRQQAADETLRKRIQSVDYQIRGKRFKTIKVGDRVLWHHQHRTEATPKLRLAYTGPYRVIRVIERDNLNVAIIKHEETGKEAKINTRKLKILQTKDEASTCLIIGCNRPAEKGVSRNTGLPKRACSRQHWELAIQGKTMNNIDISESQVKAPAKEKIMGLPGDWMLIKIRKKYYVGVALRFEEHRDEWIVQYVNTYGKHAPNSKYRRCWIDEKDGMEFFSSQPSRITSRYRPLITNVKYNQIKGVTREDEKGRIPRVWIEKLAGRLLVKQVRTPMRNYHHTHNSRRGHHKNRQKDRRSNPPKHRPQSRPAKDL
jgi:hypothetical protein